jgi:cysteine desulfurase
MRVYLDHNATTPVHPRVRESASQLIENWGNPSSIHWAGRDSKNILRETRQTLAQQLGCQALDLVFNSGGTEGNNTVILSAWSKLSASKDHFLCSQVEHPSVMKTYEHLQTLGARVDFIPVSRQGELDLDFIKNKLSAKTALISVMLANNETGTIFPLRQIVQMAQEIGALVHTDGVQALGKIPLNLQELGVHYATFSAHKFYATKGSGFVYIKRGSPFSSLIHGGGQERHRRGGTENVFGIACLGLVAPLLSEVSRKATDVEILRNHFESRVLEEIPQVQVTGAAAPRICNTSSLTLSGVDGETLLMSLDLKGFAVSTGAACSSGNPEPSPVLLAMGLSRDEAQTSLRVSLGWENTLQEIDLFVDVLKNVVHRLRSLRSQRELVMHV